MDEVTEEKDYVMAWERTSSSVKSKIKAVSNIQGEAFLEEIMNITTYLGANEGNDPTLYKAVTELGAWIGQGGNTLVYGGSKAD